MICENELMIIRLRWQTMILLLFLIVSRVGSLEIFSSDAGWAAKLMAIVPGEVVTFEEGKLLFFLSP